MKKLWYWLWDNFLGLATLFLLAFIPLYPKLPLFDVRHTWVYIRLEDFVVFFVLFGWGLLLVSKKISLRTPLTVPILAFWLIGLVATIHGILLFFPAIADAHPTIALFSFIRRIEYMSLFFISFAAMKGKRLLVPVIVVLVATAFVVSAYGIGQKYLGLPAFLTMNEEFAKGIPIRLSPLSRVSSTFSGHYDLAAFFVLTLPIVASLIFGVRSLLFKGVLLAISLGGFVVLFMTVSRISFFALFFSLGLVLFLYRKKFVIVSIPVIAVVTLVLISLSPGLVGRFGSTIKEIDVLIDAKTGGPVGHPREVPKTYFADKTVKQQFHQSVAELKTSSPSAQVLMPYTSLPEKVILLTEPSLPTGEDLPEGTGYINLPLSPVKRKLGHFFYQPRPRAGGPEEIFVINGSYLLKKAFAYDLSFTTRFQGEWPRAIAALKKNILVGSGYGSVGLAVDNSYLRMLGETGVLGLGAFLAILVTIGIYIRKTLPQIDAPLERSFVIGFAAGVVGLAVNAVFIDVYEASKIAYLLWLLAGIVLGILVLHAPVMPDIRSELKKIVTSPAAVIAALFIVAVVLYSPIVRNFFVGDDFTWFRWAADQPSLARVVRYFTDAEGFFYRPGTKTYFHLLHSVFWLNQTVYHFVSLFLHFFTSALVFFLTRKILKNHLLAVLASFLFLSLSAFGESVQWVAATGLLASAAFSLLSLLFSIAWQEKRKTISLIAALSFFVLSLLFHELGLITPLLFLLYTLVFGQDIRQSRLLFLPVPFYLAVRYLAQSHWLSGDYNYNLLKLPLNAVGNTIGYFFLTILGPVSMPVYQLLRGFLRGQIALAATVVALIALGIWYLYKHYAHEIKKEDKKIYLFGSLFFVISLVPFLGLGNISSRYSYVAAIGIVLLLVAFIKKFYAFLLENGKPVAAGCTALVAGTFFLFQIIGGQQITADWYEAGKKANKMLTSIQGAYEDYWSYEPMELHFVNVPIKTGDAWIFPVGFNDALWLVFRNPAMRVFLWPSTAAAYEAIDYTSVTRKIFEFDEDGNVFERTKKAGTQ